MSEFNQELLGHQQQNLAEVNETPTPTTEEFKIPDDLFTVEEQPTEQAPESPEIIVPENKELIPDPINKGEELFASKFAALSRKEKLLRDREDQLKRQMDESPLKDIDRLKKEDPLALLEKLGLSYEDITRHLLNKNEVEDTPDFKYSKLEKKVQAMESRREDEEKLRLEEQQNKVVTDYKDGLNTFLKSDTEKYEFITATESQDLVFQTISDHYNDTGKILSNEEAAEAVETYLEKKVENLSRLNKFKTKYLGEKPQAIPSEENKEIKVNGTTLSNDISTMRPTTAPDGLLSKEDAMKMIRWED